nr:MAG TPA: hypothetical protein [Caudoviricetes sp.]
MIATKQNLSILIIFIVTNSKELFFMFPRLGWKSISDVI